MATITKEFTVWKGAIPEGCFLAGKKVRARLTGVDGFDTLDMEIQEIDEGDGDTDVVTFSYESTDIDGATLSNCNLAAFYCLCDCCTVAVPLAVHLDGDLSGVVGAGATWPLGGLHRTFEADSIVFEFPGFVPIVAQEITLRLYHAGDLVCSLNVYGAAPVRIPRTSFESAFASGRFDLDAGGLGEPFTIFVGESTPPPSDRVSPEAPLLVQFIGRFIP